MLENMLDFIAGRTDVPTKQDLSRVDKINYIMESASNKEKVDATILQYAKDLQIPIDSLINIFVLVRKGEQNGLK